MTHIYINPGNNASRHCEIKLGGKVFVIHADNKAEAREFLEEYLDKHDPTMASKVQESKVEIKDLPLYKVNIHYEVITHESAEKGDVDRRGTEVEGDQWTLPEIIHKAENLGINPWDGGEHDPRWWRSLDPVQDRAFFEKGEERFFSLHVTDASGRDVDVHHPAGVAINAGLGSRGQGLGCLLVEEDSPAPSM